MLKSRMLKIIPLPAFTDNYIWAIVYGNSCVVVDPGDSSPVFDFLESNNLGLERILITHHHSDHTGGMLALAKKYDCPVYGPTGEHIKGLTSKVSEGDEITIFNLKLKIFDTPGHTLDHIAYFHSSDKGSYLFCGDTLFSGGCGRLFEGTAEDMFYSLNKFISLPEETLVFCAHEYTQSNLKFALSVNPSNLDLIKYSKKVDELRSNSKITLPSNIGLEKKINPFFLLNDKEILKNSEEFISGKISNSIESLAAIRSMKDSF